jgi:hypothetical protein
VIPEEKMDGRSSQDEKQDGDNNIRTNVINKPKGEDAGSRRGSKDSASSADSFVPKGQENGSIFSVRHAPGKIKALDSTTYLTTRKRRASVTIADTIASTNNDPHAHVSSLQEGRRAMISTMTIVDNAEKTGNIASVSLLELLRTVSDNIKGTIDGVSIPMVTDRDGIGELRGRDLCRLTKFGNDSNSLVFLVKQHCLIVSFRYDMRAVIESNRITFIAHEGENASLERIRAFMLGMCNEDASVQC